MTAFNHKVASEKLVELGYVTHIGTNFKFITQDIGTMATLAIDNGIDILNLPKFCWCVSNVYDNKEYHKDHADKYEAARVAIYKALIKLKE